MASPSKRARRAVDLKHVVLKHVVLAAALLVAGHAFAGTFMGEAGVSHGSGGRIDVTGYGSRDSLLVTGALGYRFDTGLGVRGLFIQDGDPYRGLFSTDRSFNTFYGVEATAYIPVLPKLNLMGGLGIGQTSLNHGPESGHDQVGDGIVSAGIQYHFVRNFALELHADYLTHTGESSVGLMFQVPF